MAVGVADVDPVTLAAGAEQRCGTHFDVGGMSCDKGVEACPIGHERNVVDVAAIGCRLEQVDQRRVVDAQRHERRVTRPPGVEAFRGETEMIGVPRDRPLDVGNAQHEVIDSGDDDRLAHGADRSGVCR